MKVLVRFKGDNDFGKVLRAFGELLLRRMERGELVTQALVHRWFNELAPGLYELVQSRHPESGLADIRSYLRIAMKDVYVDADADAVMETAHQWANCDSVMVTDFEHARDKVYLV